MIGAAQLRIMIGADVANAVRGMGDVESRAHKMGNAVKGAAAAGLAIAGAATVKFGVDAVKAAGDLEQSQGAVETVFKKSSGQMLKFSDDAAQSVGLSKNSYNELATLMGTQLKNGGTSIDQLGTKTNDLIKVGADLSSMYGGDTKEAVEALSSALKGERDPIERYGVSLNQAKIDAEAASLGFKKVGGSLSTEANQAATLSLIMKQTKDAHGNFAKESDTLQGKQQRLAAQFENVKTTIGSALLPIASEFFGFLNDTAGPAVSALADWFGKLDLKGLVSQFTAGGGAASGLSSKFSDIKNAAVSFWNGLQPTINTIQTQLIPGFMDLAQRVFPPVIAAFLSVIPPIMSVGQAIIQLVVAIIGRLIPVWQTLAPVVVTAFQGIMNVIRNALNVIGAIIRTVTALIKGDWSGVWNGIKDTFAAVWGLIKAIVTGYVNYIKAYISAGLNMIKGVFSAIWGSIGGVVKGAWNGIRSATTSALSAVKGAVSGAWNAVKGATSAAWNGIKGAISGALSAIKGVISSGLNTAKGVMSAAWNAIKSTVTTAWTNIKQGVSDGIGKVVSLMRELPGKAKGALGNIGSTLLSAGSDLIGGFLKGIRDKAGSIASTIKDSVTDKIPGWVKKPLGINSPSKVMARIAEGIPEGMAMGITRAADLVKKPMAHVAAKVMDTRFTLPAPTIEGRATSSTSGRGSGAPVTVNISFNGLVTDRVGTAREIQKMLAELGVLEGVAR